jgi:putative transposase
MEINDQYHNGYHTGIMRDDNILIGPRIRFDLHNISDDELRFWSTQEIGIPTRPIQRAYKFRITDVTPEQVQQMSQYFGNERFLWNKLVAEQKALRVSGQKALSHFDMNKLITLLKVDHPFLKESPSQALQARAGALAKGQKAALDKKNPATFPDFKKKGKCSESFTLLQGCTLLQPDCITVPKLGNLYFINGGNNPARQKTMRIINGNVNSVTISFKQNAYWISIQTELTVEPLPHPSISEAALDLGVARFCTLSNGEFFLPLNAFKAKQDRLAIMQRQLSRQVKLSNNWHFLKNKINKLHCKIANMRKDFLHKISTYLCNSHAVIYVEDLKVKNMMASAAGTIENPGKNVKQKSGLNRSIADQGWAMFLGFLRYKQDWRGGRVIEVPPYFTSQRCPKCGFTHALNREDQSHFGCINPECNFTANADYVASLNIKVKGQTAPDSLVVLSRQSRAIKSGTCSA